MLPHHIRELIADFHDRVERIHGALEDDGDPAPAELAQFRIIHFQDILAFEEDLPAGDQGRGMQDAQDGMGDGGFAAAGFAGQTDHFARLNGERNPIHRLDRSARGQVSHPQIPDIQQRAIQTRGSLTTGVERFEPRWYFLRTRVISFSLLNLGLVTSSMA